ncbi:hypothetical protein D3C84_512180 [compost metagenome]
MLGWGIFSANWLSTFRHTRLLCSSRSVTAEVINRTICHALSSCCIRLDEPVGCKQSRTPKAPRKWCHCTTSPPPFHSLKSGNSRPDAAANSADSAPQRCNNVSSALPLREDQPFPNIASEAGTHPCLAGRKNLSSPISGVEINQKRNAASSAAIFVLCAA